jgi:PadR family transcriptional regulator PadR
MSGISSDIIRGYNDTMILYLLLEAPSYGYEISKRIKELSDEKYIIKETTLYSAFTRMEKNGFIESFYDSSNPSGKRRTYYRITRKGIEYYHEKCSEWLLTKEVVEKFITDKENLYGNNQELS